MRMKITALILVLAMTVSLASCSRSLGPETLPETTLPTTTETSETSETTTETTETEPLGPEPTSVPVVSKMAAKQNGMLYVSGNQLVNSKKNPVVLRGMSSDILSECQGFFGAETVKTLAEDWGIDVLRIAVPADKGTESYISNAEKYFKQTCEIIDLCIAQGIYVIVDWHINIDGNPATNQKKAIEFFTRIAGVYADSPNVIYEICNEPNGTKTVKNKKGKSEKVNIDWNNSVKPYAEAVIKAIRAIDKDNLIIVGTSDWCRDIDKAASNPIKLGNIAYSVHFNAVADGADLQKKITDARTAGICVIATEWKTTDSSGVGAPHAENSNDWLDFLDENKISWCNSYIGGNNSSTTNALIFGGQRYTLEDIFAGHWPQGLLSESGLIVRNRLLASKGVSQPEVKPEDMPKETAFPDDQTDAGDAGDAPDSGDEANEDMPEE